MHKEVQQIFDQPFLKRLKIKHFPIDPDQIDTDPKFQEKLFNSLMNGWQNDQSLVIAISDDPTLDGLPIQGLNRILMFERVLKHNPKYDFSQVKVRFESISTWESYKTRRAEYEILATLSKSEEVSQTIIRKNLGDVVKAHYDPDQRKMLEYFQTELGFNEKDVLLEVWQDYADKLEKSKNKKKSKGKRPVTGQQSKVPDHLRSNWGISSSATEEQSSLPLEDGATTYLREVMVTCEHCGKKTTAKVNIIIADGGKSFKILQAQLAVQK